MPVSVPVSASGRSAKVSGRDFLSSLQERGRANMPPADTGWLGSPQEAMYKAKVGGLNLWEGPFSPGADLHTLSEVVRLARQVSDVEQMLRFIIERLDE